MSKRKKEALKKFKHQQRKKGKLEQISIPHDCGGGRMGAKDLRNYNDIFKQIIEKLNLINPEEVGEFKKEYLERSRENYQNLKQKYREIFYKQ